MARRRMVEEDAQCAVVKWAAHQECVCADLGMLFHVPNGMPLVEGSKAGARWKQMGVKAGVPDLLLLASRRGFHGLAIEMKTKTGRQTTEQRWWGRELVKRGYVYALCRSSSEAIAMMMSYLYD